MALYQIHISYDGTQFQGYQRQITFRTVQGEIEEALRKVGWNEKSIFSSGRTDSGVHAEEQVAVFEMQWMHKAENLQNAINAYLPEDIAITGIEELVDGTFHPRFDARSRVYRYQVYINAVRLPLLERYYWQVWPAVDLELMNHAASQFIGQHDFRFFGKPYETDGRTERIMIAAEWMKMGMDSCLIFRAEANSFLYHMMRRIVFILIKVGQEQISVQEVANALAGNDNLPPGIAPAKGLFLEKINY
jgi:tRNA pseudouridine38-40 synthase